MIFRTKRVLRYDFTIPSNGHTGSHTLLHVKDSRPAPRTPWCHAPVHTRVLHNTMCNVHGVICVSAHKHFSWRPDDISYFFPRALVPYRLYTHVQSIPSPILLLCLFFSCHLKRVVSSVAVQASDGFSDRGCGWFESNTDYHS